VILLSGITGEAASTGSARFYGPVFGAGSSTESTVQGIVPVAGTVSDLVVAVANAPQNGGGTQKWTFSVRKNGSSSGAISCEISESATSCSSSTTLTFAAGDLISLSATPSGTPQNWGSMRWSVTLTK
jgi:hypothetical protein